MDYISKATWRTAHSHKHGDMLCECDTIVKDYSQKGK